MSLREVMLASFIKLFLIKIDFTR